jgi:iron complex outermembrane receptor protein
LTELSANPSGRGGFNPDLNQQRANSAEVGVKGWMFKKLRFEVALFRTQARREFVPFELDSLPGRTFYRNAGRSLRRGLEAAATWRPFTAFSMTANATASIFRYEDYMVATSDFKGKSLPGLPNFTAFVEPRWQHPKGGYVAAQVVHSGRFFADDANTERIAAYTLLNLRGGWLFTFSKMQVEPFAGLNNVGGSRYFSNVRLNAVGRRYYEPGAGLSWYGGVRVRV